MNLLSSIALHSYLSGQSGLAAEAVTGLDNFLTVKDKQKLNNPLQI